MKHIEYSPEIENLAKSNGFDNAMEMFRLVGQVDISTPEKLARFEQWRDEDGSKSKLLLLIAGVDGSERLDFEESDTAAQFREGWRQAMEGETHPIETLWDEFKKDDDG